MNAGPDARTRLITDDLRSVLEPAGLQLEDVSVQAVGKRRIVRVLVDRESADLAGDSPIEPLSLDEIGDATALVSDRLDETDVMGPQPYVLEVSSPGTDRPLTQPRHFRRNVGRLVQIVTTDGDKVTGRIVRTEADRIWLDVIDERGKSRAEREIALADIAKGKVQVEFNRPDGKDN